MRIFGSFFVLVVVALGTTLSALMAVAANREFHVSVNGKDTTDGTVERPLRSLSEAAQRAQAGDLITVHEGVYRESVNPPRGGLSDTERIVYQAAPGERVEIKGSEVIKGWEPIQGDTWKVDLPNRFFGDYNPYQVLIHGDWFNPKGREHHTGAVYVNGDWLMEAANLEEVLNPGTAEALWFGQVGEETTTIWAQFRGVEPNRDLVEINVRRSVFYPDQPGRNYITVRGFILRQAATQWAPPTAEQVGLLGTHWSKGWIIESNIISHSKCTGITLGKYGDEWDNTSEDTAEGYVKTIERALENGWSRENIGGHMVRNNVISHCEQAGIVGSLGAAFSVLTGNTIHDIHVESLFTGAEMAGIKIHAAIDTEISHNRIFRTVRGIWLDWMAQGARVTGNLLFENKNEDLFVEVNHGPFLVDNNLFLSDRCLLNMSEGGAYVHNLMAGQIVPRSELSRETPFHPPHSTQVAGLRNIVGGDDRFYNNIIAGGNGLVDYDQVALPSQMSGNVFLKGAVPSKQEPDPIVLRDFDPGIGWVEKAKGLDLQIELGDSWDSKARSLVTSDLLGTAKTPNLPYVNPNDTPIRVDHDYFGKKRNPENPYPGPFELPEGGKHPLRVWLPDGLETENE